MVRTRLVAWSLILVFALLFKFFCIVVLSNLVNRGMLVVGVVVVGMNV